MIEKLVENSKKGNEIISRHLFVKSTFFENCKEKKVRTS